MEAERLGDSYDWGPRAIGVRRGYAKSFSGYQAGESPLAAGIQ